MSTVIRRSATREELNQWFAGIDMANEADPGAEHASEVVLDAGQAAVDAPPVNAPALYDFLHCLSEAVLLAESGDDMGAGTYELVASAAVVMAFPIGSPESRALGLILTAAGRVTEDVP
jgi:hypothetical protein